MNYDEAVNSKHKIHFPDHVFKAFIACEVYDPSEIYIRILITARSGQNTRLVAIVEFSSSTEEEVDACAECCINCKKQDSPSTFFLCPHSTKELLKTKTHQNCLNQRWGALGRGKCKTDQLINTGKKRAIAVARENSLHLLAVIYNMKNTWNP